MYYNVGYLDNTFMNYFIIISSLFQFYFIAQYKKKCVYTAALLNTNNLD